MKIAYHFEPNTQLYSGRSSVHKIAGYDHYILPQLATFIEPPECNNEKQQCRYDPTSEEWIIENRPLKVMAYHKLTLRAKEFNDESLVTDLYTLLVPPSPYHDFISDKWTPNITKAIEAKHHEINCWRTTLENDENQTVTAISCLWDAGPSARLRIDSTLLTGQMPPYWTDANNVDHQGMTLNELKQVKIAISELGFAIHDRQRTMKKEVEILTEVEEILNYSVGWPEE
ncbi:DUF4376 domain-containing protein [Vibrio bivalvicida]|uniref:DUF4376 domain-containing protein n=1 Tax=Vibrio bivalvicida TaxID=1276888 RepID=A0ABV4MLJ1_9VIBR